LAQTYHQPYLFLNPCLWRRAADAALLWAAENGNQQAEREALDMGANINAQVQTMEERSLFKHPITNAKINRTTLTPLALAIINGHEEMISFLLTGLDVDLLN
jgi:ankyrin repeat protein